MSVPFVRARPQRLGVRSLLFVLAVCAITLVLISRRDEAETVARTLARGHGEWIAAAACLQAVYFGLYAALYQASLRVAGVRLRIGKLLPIWFAATFLNVVTPAAGASLLVTEAARRANTGAARAAAGVVLVKIADVVSFFPLLAVALVYLLRRHDLKPYELAAAAASVALVGVWCGVFGLGLWRPRLLLGLLRFVQNAVNAVAKRVRRARNAPPLLPEDWANGQAREYTEAARACLSSPAPRVITPFLFGFAAHLADIASLGCLFRAFGQTIAPGALVAGFAVGLLFWIVSVTPEGVGAVEGMMTLAFVSLGVPAARAAVVTLAFRGLTFYLPVLLGMAFARRFLRSVDQAAPPPFVGGGDSIALADSPFPRKNAPHAT